MTTGVTVNGVPVATNLIGGFHLQLQKNCWGVTGQYVETSGQDPLPTSLRPIGNSGTLSHQLISGVLAMVKPSSGQVYGILATNCTTSCKYLKFFDKNLPVLGTDEPEIIIGLPPNFSLPIPIQYGTPFFNKIWVAATASPSGLAQDETEAFEVLATILFI